MEIMYGDGEGKIGNMYSHPTCDREPAFIFSL